ncbi:MAG: putative beta-lysine N-acetyltransferase [Bacillota bacterium]
MDESKTLRKEHADYTMEIFLDPYNRRVRIDDYQGNITKIITESETIAKENNAEKLIIKSRMEQFGTLIEYGFRCEGRIGGYFLGSNCLFFSKFYSSDRKESNHWLKEEAIMSSVSLLEKQSNYVHPPTQYLLKKMGVKDAARLAKLYQQVFQIYPTPLNKPDYIKKTMQEGTIYYGFECDGEIVSAASAEVNLFYKNAELTDCATLTEHRKYGLMKILLIRLEKELKEKGIYCSYSIARSLSFGMNAALHQLGYRYQGRLINNCYIYDKLEDMNVWVRDLSLNST